MRPSQRGFTLTELLAVMAIIGVLGFAGIASLAGDTAANDASAMSRRVHVLLMRARGEAVADGFQRRLLCQVTTNSTCIYQMATTPGMAAPAAWQSAGETIQGGKDGVVWAISGTTSLTTAAPGAGPLALPTAVTFFPDGTATAATIFVCDSNQLNQYKVYVFPATGLPRLVAPW